MVRGCRLGIADAPGVCHRRCRDAARRAGVRAWRPGALGDGGLGCVLCGRCGGSGRRGDRDTARAGGRESAKWSAGRGLERGLAVHAINPKQLDRFRDRLSPAGAKDDRRDARVLASALRTDPHCLRRLEPTDPAIVELREWSRISEELTRERTRQANRMREQLWRMERGPQRSIRSSRPLPRPPLAGGGDDRRDARVLASALRTDPHCLRRLERPTRRSSSCGSGRASAKS